MLVPQRVNIETGLIRYDKPVCVRWLDWLTACEMEIRSLHAGKTATLDIAVHHLA